MSDKRLRGLERRWKESGSIEDEVKLLQERVRMGDLTQERLRLASYCGHPASLAALNMIGPTSPDSLETLEEWFRGLEAWGIESHLRGSLAVTKLVLPYFERSTPEDLRPRQAIQSAIDWIACPCEEHVEKTNSASGRLMNDDFCDSWIGAPPRSRPVGMQPGELMLMAISVNWENNIPQEVACIVWDVSYSFCDDENPLERVIQAIRNTLQLLNRISNETQTDASCNVPMIHDSITQVLTPWALGYRDPVFEPDFLPPLPREGT